MKNVVQYKQNVGNGRGLSQLVFRNLPLDQAADGQCPGQFVFEDFINPPATPTSPFKGFTLAAGTIAGSNVGYGGTLDLSTAATDNTEAILSTLPIGYFTDKTSNVDDSFAFEARVQVDTVAAMSLILGISDGTVAANFGDDGLLASTNNCFAIVASAAASTLAFRAQHADAGVGVRDVGSASSTLLAAATWVKLGIRFEKQQIGGPLIIYSVNGSEIARLENRIDSLMAAESDDTDDTMYAFVGVHTDAAAAKKLTIDQVGFFSPI